MQRRVSWAETPTYMPGKDSKHAAATSKACERTMRALSADRQLIKKRFRQQQQCERRDTDNTETQPNQ